MSNSASARYPNRFEIFRLEPLGDPPYLPTEVARERYAGGKTLEVTSAEHPPRWFLLVSSRRSWFKVTYYSATTTPIREVMWEREGDGLFCRRTVDLFYPDGDPEGRVRYLDVFSVAQRISTDGVVEVETASPIESGSHVVTGVPTEEFRAAEPDFGEWGPLVAAGAPDDLQRFGLDAVDAAILYAERCAARGSSEVEYGGWRIPLGAEGVMGAVDALISGARPHEHIAVLERGEAQVIPLAVQADPRASKRNASEEHRRMRLLAEAVRDACEHREGRGIPLDLGHRGRDRVGAYVAGLRDAGASSAEYWEYGTAHAVVLVWTGDEEDGTLTLALHVLPASWVSERRTKPAGDRLDVRWTISEILEPRGASAPPDTLV